MGSRYRQVVAKQLKDPMSSKKQPKSAFAFCKSLLFLIFPLLLSAVFPVCAKTQVFRASSSAGFTGVTSVTITKPSGTISGDVMIASISVRPSGIAITAPAGWTLITRTSLTSGSTHSLSTYWKAAGATEPASYSWTFDASTIGAGGIMSFYNVNTTAPINISSGRTTASSLSHATNSVTTSVTNTMLVAVHTLTSCATWTAPPGMTEAVDVASNPVPRAEGKSLAMSYVVQAAQAATGTKTATASNDADAGITQIIALASVTSQRITSWKGTSSTSWTNAANWTNGVPVATSETYVGDANFTGTNQPTIGSTATCKTLTIGGGTKASTVNGTSNLTVNGNLIINTNGTMLAKGTTLTVYGNWTNNGVFTPSSVTTSSQYSTTTTYNSVIFAGSVQAIGGTATTTFQRVTINTGAYVTLNSTIGISRDLTVNGTFDPNNPAKQVTGNRGISVSSTGTLKVTAATVVGNYNTSVISLSSGSTVDYSATLVNQTVSSSYTYSTLKISGALVKSLAANLPSLSSGSSTRGNISVIAGTLNLSTFTAARGTSNAGGTLSVSNGAFLRIGGTNTLPANYATVTLGATSTVEYYGNAQAVSARTYGHLILSGTTGAIVKTMPATAFTVAGNFSSTLGTATSVTFTAASNITFAGSVSIGASTVFNGSATTGTAFAHTVAGNWANNGTFTGNLSTVTMSGTGATITGTGTHNFNNLAVTGAGITATVSSLGVTGNFFTSGMGTFTQATGGLTMTNTVAKTISGTGISLNDLTIAGLVTTTASFPIAGNFTVNTTKSFTSSAGVINMTGAAKTISAAGTLSLYNLTVDGTITTATNFTISSVLDVNGSLTATNGVATFTGTSILYGTANLFDVTLNGTSLQLSTDAILGIAGVLTKTAGTLNVTSTIPNTVHFNGSANRTIPSGAFHHVIFSGATYTAGGAITVNGNLTINTGATFAGSTFTHILNGNWINSGTFTANTSTVECAGAADATITGATTFSTLTLNKSAASNNLTFLSNISVGTINMTQGQANTGSNILTITTTRTGPGIIIGSIQRAHLFTTGVAYEFEGQNNTVTFSAVSGVTSVLVKVTKGAVTDFPFGGSLNRTYEISVPAGTYIADLRLHYEDAELNGNHESTMNLWRFGTTWTGSGKASNSTSLNYVEQTGLTDIATRWTCSDDANVVNWNGSVSSDWNTAANWTVLQGSSSTPPSVNDIVQIGVATYTNAPVITTAATAKSISFGSTLSSSLTLSTGGSLTVQGNVNGTWSTNATHAINANNQIITVNGDAVLSDGTTGHAINLNIGTGTVNITGSLTETGGANITFSGAGEINIGGNFTYVSGTFTKGTGTVNYNGASAQTVARVGYHNLSITKSAGIALAATALNVGGNLTVASGEFDFSGATTVEGNVTVASGAILNNLGVTATVAGNWNNSGNYISSNGTIIFNGTGSQTISATTFNIVTINKPSGTASLTGNISINGNLTVSSGTFDLATFTSNRSAVGGTFTLASGTTLLAGGANNFPANFSNNIINSNSTFVYNGTVAQAVAAVTYGNLIFSNGTTNAKTLTGTTTVAGDLTINTGATVNAASSTLNLSGNMIKNGAFAQASGTVNLNGTGKTVTGNTAFNNLSIYGSYTFASSNYIVHTFLFVPSGGSLNAGAATVAINGNLTNSGTLISTGTLTFSGNIVKTIKFENALVTSLNVVNFNGVASPNITSTSTPVFNTVNINNTGGVTANMDWIVETAFNVNAGATFNGGSASHTLNGSFTNNGTVTSSGTLNFTPATAQTIKLAGTNFSSTGLVVFGGSAETTITGTPTMLTNVTIANTTGITPSTNWTMNGDFYIDNNAIFNAGNFTYTVGGSLTSVGTLNEGTSTFTMSGTGTIAGNSTSAFYNLVIDGATTADADFNVSHDFTNNGTFDASAGTLIMTGNLPGVIGGTSPSFNLAKLNVEKSEEATVTLGHNIASVSALTITTGTLNTDIFTVSQDTVNGGLLTISENATLKIGGTNSLPDFGGYVLDKLSTVDYAGTNQTVSMNTSYGNLTISTAGTKTSAGSLNILNNFTLTNGTFVGGNFVDSVGGNWNMTSGTFTNTGTTITFNGIDSQFVHSTGAFNNVIINKASGETVLSANTTVAGTLTFAAGKITTGTHTLITTSGNITGAAQGTGWVYGNLQRNFSAAALTGTFNIGGSTYYTPVTLTFAAITSGGAITASTADSAHPNLAGSTANTIKNVPRYWSLINTGGVAFSTYTISLNWDAAENYAGFSTSAIRIGQYSASVWSVRTVTGIPATTNLQANEITAMGDFVIAEQCYNTAGFSYTGTPYCSNGGSASVSLSSGATAGTFTFVPAGLSIAPSTGVVDLAASTAGTYTVTNTTGTGGCIVAATATVTIRSAGLWTGTVNNDWNNAGNWLCGGVPAAGISVNIPGNLTVFPVISSGNAIFDNLNIASGASLIVSGGLVQISGTVTNSGTFDVTNGGVMFNGTSAQTISANLFAANTVKNLVINNAAGVTLAGNLRVTGLLSFGNSNNNVFNTGGFLTLASSVTGTGQVGDLTNNGTNTGNTINGAVTVERFVTARRAYRFVTAPVYSTTIKQNWMENTNNATTAINNNPVPGYGTHITGSGGNVNGFDASNTNNPSLYTFDNVTQSWIAATTTALPLKPGIPYRLFVRGDRSISLRSNTPTPTFTTLRAKGTLHTGTVVLAKPGGGGTAGMPELSPADSAYSLIANPYAAVVDFRSVVKTDVSRSIYYFDPTIAGSNGRGGYVSYNDLYDTVSNPSSRLNYFIQSGQAFFVQTTGANPTITFRERNKASTNRPVFRPAGARPRISVRLMLPGKELTEEAADGLIAYFSDDLSSSIGQDDSYKFVNQDENIAIVRNGKNLSIEGRKSVKDNDTLPLKIWQLTQKRYALKINVSNFGNNVESYLQDAELKTSTRLNNNQETLIPFSITSSAASSAADRFTIVFRTSVTLPVHMTGVKAVEKNKGVEVEWKAENESNIDHYEVERSTNAVQFVTVGSVTAKNNGATASAYTWFDAKPVQGDNFYRIKSVDKSGEIKYTSVVTVDIQNVKPEITASVNQGERNSINLTFKNLEQGNYEISLINSAGQKVYEGTIIYGGGTATKTLKINQLLAAGIYHLQVLNNNKFKNIQMLIQ